jgi:hypothetical protein
MKIKLTNENHRTYARTDDACEAFKRAVANGQARLALEMMVDIVDYISGLAEPLNNEDSDITGEITAEQAVKEVQEKQQVKASNKRQAVTKNETQEDSEGKKEEE